MANDWRKLLDANVVLEDGVYVARLLEHPEHETKADTLLAALEKLSKHVEVHFGNDYGVVLKGEF